MQVCGGGDVTTRGWVGGWVGGREGGGGGGDVATAVVVVM